MGYASNWQAPSMTAADFSADPNTTPPSSQQIHKSHYRGIAALIVLSLVGPNNATATAIVWVRDENIRTPSNAVGTWVAWSPTISLTTVSGIVSVPGVQAPPVGADVYVQLVSVANAPTALYAGYLPTAG